MANDQAWLRTRKFKPVVLCRRLPNNALKGTRREASSCFAGIPAAHPLARALGGKRGSRAAMSAEPAKPEVDAPFRKWVSRICVVGILLWAGFFFALLIYQSLCGEMLPKNWFLQMVQQHPASTVGIGISAISAFFIVAVLELTTGAVQFEALGFKFQGAAGQVVLWVLCFLSMVFATWLLWDKA